MSIPTLRRPLFWLAERALPGLDRERVWRRVDQEAPRAGEVTLEHRIAEALRPLHPLVATVTLAVFVAGVWLVWAGGPRLSARALAAGHPLLALATPLLLGMLAHGLFGAVVHEGTHGNLYGARADGWLSNAAVGLLLLPFAAETYQHFHRVHHKLVLRATDPNWTTLRQRLLERSRLLYALYELLPIVNNLDRLGHKSRRDPRKVALAWAMALLVVALLRPPPLYCLAVIVGLNTTNAVRLWTEHFGYWRGVSANVYYCPLGYGIGNHELHHTDPRVPALALWLGLALREKTGSLLWAPWRLLVDPAYGAFRAAQPDFDGSNV